MAAEDEEKGYGTRHAGVGRLLYSATDHDVSDENASATVRLIRQMSSEQHASVTRGSDSRKDNCARRYARSVHPEADAPI